MEEAGRGRSGALAPLAVRDYRLLFIGLVAGQSVMPLQFVSQIFWVQTYAPDGVKVLLIGALGAIRGVGAIAFSLVGGALADRFDRRRLLIITQSSAFVVNGAIAIVMFVGRDGMSGIVGMLALTFVSASLMAVDLPTRQAILPEILGPRLTPGGISLNNAGMQLSLPVSIFAAGLIIASIGTPAAYAVGCIGNVAQVSALLAMRHRSQLRPEATGDRKGLRRTLHDAREGIRYTRAHPTVFWLIVMSMLVTGFGMPAVANLGPTWITEVVGVPIRLFGVIGMAWGIGSFTTSVLIARVAGHLERWGLVTAAAAMVFSLSFVAFSTGTLVGAAIGNIGLGAGLAGTSVAAMSIIQSSIPNEVRGRVMSVQALNMGFAQLMTFPLAVIGQVIGLRTLFPILAVTQLACIVALLIGRPVVRRARIVRYEHEPEPPVPAEAEPPVPAEPKLRPAEDRT